MQLRRQVFGLNKYAIRCVAERVMRILVMIRKNWGGNRTEKGARVQAVLTSVLCTAKQQDKDVFALLVDLLRSADPKLLDVLARPLGGSAPYGCGWPDG